MRLTDFRADALSAGLAAAVRHLAFLRDEGLLANDGHAAAEANLQAVPGLAEAAADADLVQECASERYEVKLPLFDALEACCRADAVLARSTSGLLMSRLQEGRAHPERMLVAHPFNPPHLVPLVELVGGPATSAPVIEAMRVFYEGLGKVPVVLRKEVPGHVANRLAAALWREAVDLVDRGVASVEDVDKALRAGPGLRWALMGQHLIYHLGGGSGGYDAFIRTIGASFAAYYDGMATWREMPPSAHSAVVEGVEQEVKGRSLQDLAAWRDQRLARLLKALQEP